MKTRIAICCSSLLALASFGLTADAETILSTDFTGRTVTDNTASNITWTTNGVSDPGDLTAVDAEDGLFDTSDAQGHFAPNRNVDNEGSWSTTLTFSLTVPEITLTQVDLNYQHFNNAGEFQTADRTVNWTVTVTGSSSGLLGSKQLLGTPSLVDTATIIFDTPIALNNSEGSYDVTILAEGTTVGNNTGLAALSLNALDPPTPTITPSSGFPVADETFSLTVPVGGTGYQWAFEGGDLSGETNNVLTFDPVQESDTGLYEVSYDDGLKAPINLSYFMSVLPSGTILPLTGLLGLGLLASACAMGGASVLRRKK